MRCRNGLYDERNCCDGDGFRGGCRSKGRCLCGFGESCAGMGFGGGGGVSEHACKIIFGLCAFVCPNLNISTLTACTGR